MTDRTYARKTTTERRAERRSRLLEAALDAFGTRGYRAVSIEQLCAEAGISTRNFYEEFANRETLLIALHDDLNARALEAVVAAISELDPGDIEGRALAGVRAYFSVMTSDRRWARIALIETVGVSPEAEAARQAAIERFAAMLEFEAARWRDLGVIPDRDFRLSAIAIVGAIYGLINSWRSDDHWDEHLEAVIHEATRVIVRSVQ